MQTPPDTMSTMIEAEEWISDLKNYIMGNNEAEKSKERKNHKYRLKELVTS